jgi:hypothetical protein
METGFGFTTAVKFTTASEVTWADRHSVARKKMESENSTLDFIFLQDDGERKYQIVGLGYCAKCKVIYRFALFLII